MKAAIRSKKDTKEILEDLEIGDNIVMYQPSDKTGDYLTIVISRAKWDEWDLYNYPGGWEDIVPDQLTLKEAINILWKRRKYYNKKYRRQK